MRLRMPIVMLGTSPTANGGIATVVQLYMNDGLLRRQNVTYICTHCCATPTDKIKTFFKALSKTAFMLSARRVEILHVHAATGTSFWRKSVFLLLAKVYRVPSVLHLHSGNSPAFYQRQCGIIGKALVQQALHMATRVVVVSKELEQWAKIVAPKSKVLTVYNPIPTEEPDEYHSRDPRTILYLGRLNRAKGVYDLLRAMPAVLAENPDAQLLLCGDGAEIETRNLIDRLKLHQNVQMLGWVNNERKAILLRSSTVFVLPSYSEGLPMSMLEAIASGLPVIVTRVGGIPEVITDQVEGSLVDPGDVDALARSITLLLKDQQKQRKMSEAAKQKTRRMFCHTRTIGRIEAIYDELRNSITHQKISPSTAENPTSL